MQVVTQDQLLRRRLLPYLRRRARDRIQAIRAANRVPVELMQAIAHMAYESPALVGRRPAFVGPTRRRRYRRPGRTPYRNRRVFRRPRNRRR